MRKGILLVVLLFALASLMGAMAYNKATVTSGQTLKVVATDQALLALKPGTGIGNKDQTASVDANGVLQLDFGKSVAPGEAGSHGLQPGSSYTWDKLITIQNKSAETVECTLNLTGGVAEAAVCATLADGSPTPPNWFNGQQVWKTGVGATPFTLGPNCSIDLQFIIDVPADGGAAKISGSPYAGSMVIDAVAK